MISGSQSASTQGILKDFRSKSESFLSNYSFFQSNCNIIAFNSIGRGGPGDGGSLHIEGYDRSVQADLTSLIK